MERDEKIPMPDPIADLDAELVTEERPSASDLRVFWRRIKPFMAAHKGRYLLALFFMVLTLGSTVLYPQLIRIVVDEAIESGSMAEVNQLILIMAGVLVVQAIAGYAGAYVLEMTAMRVLIGLKTWLFGRVMRQELGFFDQYSTGELIARLEGDVAQLAQTIKQIGPELMHFSLLGIVAMGLMVYTSPQLAGVVLVVGPLLLWGSAAIGRTLRRQAVGLQTRYAQVSQTGIEMLDGIQTVRVYNKEQDSVDRYATASAGVLDVAKPTTKTHARLHSFTNLFSEGAILIALWLGALLIFGDSLTKGSLVSFALYAAMVMRSARNISHSGAEIMRAQGATARIFEVGDRVPQMRFDGDVAPADVKGEVSLVDVHFHYPTRPESAALHGINLSISPGERLALVGSSGSGKSTIAKLVARLYDPESGAVYLDGNDLRDLDQAWLRSMVTLVPAEATLFEGTVADNIRYGRPDATDEEVLEAARVASVTAFIDELPDGFETEVGDSGRLFSSGQRQRIAIARAVLRRPRILILDEATAALDTETEAVVKESLYALPDRPTVVLVSHRLSTIVDVERVVVINAGRIEAMGTHDDLLASSSVYRELVEDQLVTD